MGPDWAEPVVRCAGSESGSKAQVNVSVSGMSEAWLRAGPGLLMRVYEIKTWDGGWGKNMDKRQVLSADLQLLRSTQSVSKTYVSMRYKFICLYFMIATRLLCVILSYLFPCIYLILPCLF